MPIIKFNHELEFTNQGVISIADIANTLLANEVLLRNAGFLYGRLIEGLTVESVNIDFRDATHRSPLREIFVGGLIVTYQEDLQKEVPLILQKLSGGNVPEEYQATLTILFFLLTLYGGSYLYKRFVGDKTPENLTDGYNKTIIHAENCFQINGDVIRESVDDAMKGTRKLSVANAVKKIILPVKKEPDAIIRSGDLQINRAQINETPNLIDLEYEEDYEIKESHVNVDIEIRAVDMDKNSQGWAGVIRGVCDKRLKMIIFPSIDKGKLFGREVIKGDVIIMLRKQVDGDYLPYEFHLLNLH